MQKELTLTEKINNNNNTVLTFFYIYIYISKANQTNINTGGKMRNTSPTSSAFP